MKAFRTSDEYSHTKATSIIVPVQQHESHDYRLVDGSWIRRGDIATVDRPASPLICTGCCLVDDEHGYSMMFIIHLRLVTTSRIRGT
jgi:hypothetical protein